MRERSDTNRNPEGGDCSRTDVRESSWISHDTRDASLIASGRSSHPDNSELWLNG